MSNLIITEMASKLSFFLKPSQLAVFSGRNYSVRPFNCHTAAITKTHRRIYLRTYPTILQCPDGSTINMKYHEPVGVIRLPLDLSTLSEEEKKDRLKKRTPKTKIKIEEEIEDDFDESRYLKKKK